MNTSSAIGTDVLRLDPAKEVARVSDSIRDTVFGHLKRKGAVVGVSGGIDSAVVAYLCARALGPNRVTILLMPERDSSPDSLRLGKMVAEALHIQPVVEDIRGILEASGCYRRRDDSIREVVADFREGDLCKISLPNVVDADHYSIFSLIVQSREGRIRKVRLTAAASMGIVAATNFKQRIRKMMEYYHADRSQYAVAGTPNRLEHDLGFFVKNGDGAADFKPIAHLYKCQVYQLAAYLGVPAEIQSRVPTTDTYSLEQTQEEFYFAVPLHKMDMCVYGKDAGIAAGELSTLVGLEPAQVERVYALIETRRRATRYLHMAPMLVESPL